MMRLFIAALSATAAASLLPMLAGCSPGTAVGGGSELAVTLVNAGDSAVRFGIEEPRAFGAGANGTLTDLTPLLQPGESTTVFLTASGATELFGVYVLLSDSGQTLLGPFACEVERFCDPAEPARVIWTGGDVLCSNLEQAVVALTNASAATVYMLAADEHPALPLLPLTPGESRYLLVDRSAPIGDLYVRVVTVDPILGPVVLTFTRCSILQSCRDVAVVFDGQALACTEF